MKVKDRQQIAQTNNVKYAWSVDYKSLRKFAVNSEKIN